MHECKVFFFFFFPFERFEIVRNSTCIFFFTCSSRKIKNETFVSLFISITSVIFDRIMITSLMLVVLFLSLISTHTINNKGTGSIWWKFILRNVIVFKLLLKATNCKNFAIHKNNFLWKRVYKPTTMNLHCLCTENWK